MTPWKLIWRSLVHYWRAHLGVLAGAAVATAVLTGALVVGDSVRGSLREMALDRLGKVHLAVTVQERTFRAELAEELQDALGAPVAAVLHLRGVAGRSDAGARVNQVQVLGIDDHFWSLGRAPARVGEITGEQVILNERLARDLDVAEGDTIWIRIERPSLLPRDAPLSSTKDASVGMSLTVAGVVGGADFGNFSLRADQLAPANAFVPLRLLQEQAGLAGRANVLLAGAVEGKDPLAGANGQLRRLWRLADADLELRVLSDKGPLELRTGRIFLPRPVAAAAAEAGPGAFGVLTYFVNEIRLGDGIRLGERSTPYSMVSALGLLGSEGGVGPIPAGMKNDEIVINEWLADDLRAKLGDEVELTYFVPGPARRLGEASSRFRVRAIVPIKGVAADRELMPPFPGVAGAENCRDWDLDLDIDWDRIRPDKDEPYWDEYGGTPKAFVTLAAGQRIWDNRFGELTAIRYAALPANEAEVAQAIRRAVNPADVGLFFQDVRTTALKASREGTDFGRLFAGLSFFLIAAGAVLMGLLFVFGIERRSGQVGTLLALGLTVRRVRRLLLAEGVVLAAAGAVVGSGGGLLYTRAVLYGLATVWSGAAGETSGLGFHARASTVLTGGLGGVLIALVAMWLALRRQVSRPVRELLAPAGALGTFRRLRRTGSAWALAIAAALGAIALVVVVAAGVGGGPAAAGAFFAAGSLLLIAGMAICYWLLRLLAGWKGQGRMTLGAVGVRGSARRIGRSLATIGLLACGSFLIVAVAANRKDPGQRAGRRDSGTGGFALVGESAAPVYHDLNSLAGRQAVGLEGDYLARVRFVQLRLRAGDDASCLNLNRAQRPSLLAVAPAELARLGAFRFVGAVRGAPDQAGWDMLNSARPGGAVPAVGDETTVKWALGRKLGDSIAYVDEHGREFRLEIVGVIANSVLQGSLLIAEDEFVRRFPSASGYRSFLIDAPPARTGEVAAALSAALADYGLELTGAARRLGQFRAVENTYLSIFHILGALGMLLGSAGMAVVVGRNVLERRGELALLRAVGFARASVRRMVLVEHVLLLALGLACGVAAALVAVAPALRGAAAEVPYASLGVTLGAVGISGVLWTCLATMLVTRGPLQAALRSE